MELLFKNARDVKLIFRDDFEKGSDIVVYCLTLEVIGILQILTLCLILASGASQKNLIKKSKSNLWTPSPTHQTCMHTGPHL